MIADAPDAGYYTDDLTLLPPAVIWRMARRTGSLFVLPAFGYVGLRKLLGLRFPPSYGTRWDRLPRIDADDLPDFVREAMAPPLAACRDAGFRPAFFVRPDQIGGMRGYSVFLLDEAGTTTAAVVWFRLRVGPQTAERTTFSCSSTRPDGGELVTAAVPDEAWLPELIPPDYEFVRLPEETPPAAAIAAHLDRIAGEAALRRFDADSLHGHTADRLRSLFAFQRSRGLLARLTPDEVDRLNAAQSP